MALVKESHDAPSLVTSREPRELAASSTSVGAQALTDALVMLGVAWAVIILVTFSLRSHIV